MACKYHDLVPNTAGSLYYRSCNIDNIRMDKDDITIYMLVTFLLTLLVMACQNIPMHTFSRLSCKPLQVKLCVKG